MPERMRVRPYGVGPAPDSVEHDAGRFTVGGPIPLAGVELLRGEDVRAVDRQERCGELFVAARHRGRLGVGPR